MPHQQGNSQPPLVFSISMMKLNLTSDTSVGKRVVDGVAVGSSGTVVALAVGRGVDAGVAVEASVDGSLMAGAGEAVRVAVGCAGVELQAVSRMILLIASSNSVIVNDRRWKEMETVVMLSFLPHGR